MAILVVYSTVYDNTPIEHLNGLSVMDMEEELLAN